MQDAELGKRFVDKLVRVSLLNGDENWIYIHIEVQGTRQVEFAKRMFVYNYRIYDKYDKPVASLAVLADENRQWKPTSYGFKILGCKHILEFPFAKLTDYYDQVDELLALENAFALITAAHTIRECRAPARQLHRRDFKLASSNCQARAWRSRDICSAIQPFCPAASVINLTDGANSPTRLPSSFSRRVFYSSSLIHS